MFCPLEWAKKNIDGAIAIDALACSDLPFWPTPNYFIARNFGSTSVNPQSFN